MTVNAFEAIILGLVQGLTEFLPVSSSGHLVITQNVLGISGDVLIFDVFVHIGTLVAVFIAYRKDIWSLLRHPFCKFTALLIVACIPTGLMGVFLNDFFTGLFSSIISVAFALILTGVILVVSDHYHGQKTIAEMSFSNALVVGFFQGCAITPGLSRSGSTIFGSLICGLKRSEAAKFSFIVSIPVILGAALKELLDMSQVAVMHIEWTYFLGAFVAALCGYFAITFFIKLLEKANLRYFSYYCWFVAAVVIITAIF